MSAARPAAVLGASGYIGQEFLRMLAGHPEFDPTMLVASDRSVGRRLEEIWKLAEEVPAELRSLRLVAATPRHIAAHAEVAFGAMPSGVAGPVESALARRGVSVFSNAADHRLDPYHPLLIPEVNPEHLELLRRRPAGEAPIVTDPNCSTTGLVLALTPVFPLLWPRVVHVATYQSLSGAGYPGVPSLGITDNVLPYIEGEEEKIAEESPRLLGDLDRGQVRPKAVPFIAHCARVGVREGHLEAVTVEARARPSRESLLKAWRTFDPLKDRSLPSAPHPPIEVRVEVDRPQPLRDRWAGSGRARGMVVVVGRVRWTPPYLRFFVLSHNAVRGGAGGSILNAELARATGFWGRTRRRRA